jgi:ferredoxin
LILKGKAAIQRDNDMSDSTEIDVTNEVQDTVYATLSIELCVDCPYCGEYFDLMLHDDLNDESAMTSAACPAGDWSIEHDKFELKTGCPSCKKVIEIEGIRW